MGSNLCCQEPHLLVVEQGLESEAQAAQRSWASVLMPTHEGSLVTVPGKALQFPKHLFPHLQNRDL